MSGMEWEVWEDLLRKGNGGRFAARDVAAMDALDRFREEMKESTAFRDDVIVEGVYTPMIAVCRDNKTCSIRAMPEADLHIGDRVKCMRENWIIIELFRDQIGIYHGEMWICNDVLRFQNHAPRIHSRKCVVDDGSYMRLTRNFAVYVPQNTYTVYVPLDDEVRRLYVDKRISFGTAYDSNGALVLEVYKITGIDVQSDNYGAGSHLATLKIQRDVYNPGTDLIDERICDYCSDSSDEGDPTVYGSSMISGRDYIRVGTTRKFTATFYDEHGNEVAGVNAIWSVNCPTGVERVVDGNVVSVSVPLSEELVGAQITISLRDSENKYGTYEKKVQVNPIG